MRHESRPLGAAGQAVAVAVDVNAPQARIRAVLLTELRAYRAGELVPDGMVAVPTATVSAWVETTAGLVGLHCLGNLCPVGYPKCGATNDDDDKDGPICRHALLAHFGLAPEPDPAHQRAGEEAGR